MSVVTWVLPDDCDPPHGLDMDTEHDRQKVYDLAVAFTCGGFDIGRSALVGYPKDGRIQLLSGTHRHRAAKLVDNMPLPVALWLGTDIENAWGDLNAWMRVMKDIPVRTLMKWTRDDIERYRDTKKTLVRRKS